MKMVKKRASSKYRRKKSVRKEFNEFAQRISRLKSLKKELNALNTKGFETEVKIIKSKLKNVNAIPSIEKDIDNLRNAIRKKASKSKNHAIRSKLLKESKGLKENSESIKRKIYRVEKLIKKKKKISTKKKLSKKELMYVRDISNLEKNFNLLRKDFLKHMKLIQNLTSLLERLKQN